jgi:hypothetical protein
MNLPPNMMPRSRVELILPTNQYSLGEQIKGQIKIFTTDAVDSTQTVVWLFCNEGVKKTHTYYTAYISTQSDYWDHADILRTYQTLFGPARFPPNFVGTYSFALTIPLVARETFYGIDQYLKWFLHPVIYQGNCPIIQTAPCEIIVVKQQSNPNAAVTKEIVKEVILIPCTYCNGLMPQASTFCPNCGARRKG